jgi:hypothetical protein
LFAPISCSLFRATIVEVFLGGVLRLKLEGFEQYYKANISIVHEDYNERDLSNDVGIVCLSRNVTISTLSKLQFTSTNP